MLTRIQLFFPARSPLHIAAINCDAVALEMMLAAGGDVDFADSDGKSAATLVQEATMTDQVAEDPQGAKTLVTGHSDAVTLIWSPERHVGFVRGAQSPKVIRAILQAAVHGKRNQERLCLPHTYTALPVQCFFDALSTVHGGWHNKY